MEDLVHMHSHTSIFHWVGGILDFVYTGRDGYIDLS